MWQKIERKFWHGWKKVLEKTNEQEQIPVPHKKLKAGVGFSGFIVYPIDAGHSSLIP